jgi:hypothetical protein
MNKVVKYSNGYLRENSQGILHPKGNNIIRKRTPFDIEGSLSLIIFRNSNMMVALESICKRIGFIFHHLIKNFITKTGRERVMRTS